MQNCIALFIIQVNLFEDKFCYGYPITKFCYGIPTQMDKAFLMDHRVNFNTSNVVFTKFSDIYWLTVVYSYYLHSLIQSDIHGVIIIFVLYYSYNRFTALWTFSGTTLVNWYQKCKTSKVKPIWIYWSKK